MVLFADFTLNDLAGQIHGNAADLVLELIHCLLAFLFNIRLSLGLNGSGMFLRRGDDLFAPGIRCLLGCLDNFIGLGFGIGDTAFIFRLHSLRLGAGFSGNCKFLIRNGLALGNDLLDGLEQEFTDQYDLDQQVEHLCQKCP